MDPEPPNREAVSVFRYCFQYFCMPSTGLVDFLEPIDNLGNRRKNSESLQIVNFETSVISRFLEILDPHTQLLLKFTVKNLLESEHFVSLAPFCGHLSKLREEGSGSCAASWLGSQQAQSAEPLELNLSQRRTSFKAFLKTFCAAQVQEVRGMNKGDQGERLARVKELLLRRTAGLPHNQQ